MERDRMTTAFTDAPDTPWPYMDRMREDCIKFLDGWAAARVAVRAFVDDSPTSPGPWRATEITDGVMAEAAVNGQTELKRRNVMAARDELVSNGVLIPAPGAKYRARRRSQR